MIAKFAKKINEILIQKEIVQKEDAELYQYGIENGIVVAGNLLASGIFGIVTGRPGLVLVFLLFYASLRSYSGGSHCKSTGTKNLLLSGASGIGMGILGIGLPDIPVFTGMILKNIYETALHYGYSYESREEKYFILLLIQGAVSYGETFCEIDGKLNEFISCGTPPEEYQEKKQIEETAGALSKELLYMKFLQGIPVVGAVGGAYDAIYMKRITEYAGLKYRHRYLDAQKSGMK